MNGIANFRLCTLSNQELIEAVDKATDEIYSPNGERRLIRHITARPNEDYDLIVGELIHRFADATKRLEKAKEMALENNLTPKKLTDFLLNEEILELESEAA